MVTLIFRSWIVCLALSGGISPGPSTATNSLEMVWAESRFIARNKQIIADPSNCMLTLNVIFHFFLTDFDFSLSTNKLKENF
jgi:hypothetical protein